MSHQKNAKDPLCPNNSNTFQIIHLIVFDTWLSSTHILTGPSSLHLLPTPNHCAFRWNWSQVWQAIAAGQPDCFGVHVTWTTFGRSHQLCSNTPAYCIKRCRRGLHKVIISGANILNNWMLLKEWHAVISQALRFQLPWVIRGAPQSLQWIPIAGTHQQVVPQHRGCNIQLGLLYIQKEGLAAHNWILSISFRQSCTLNLFHCHLANSKVSVWFTNLWCFTHHFLFPPSLPGSHQVPPRLGPLFAGSQPAGILLEYNQKFKTFDAPTACLWWSYSIIDFPYFSRNESNIQTRPGFAALDCPFAGGRPENCLKIARCQCMNIFNVHGPKCEENCGSKPGPKIPTMHTHCAQAAHTHTRTGCTHAAQGGEPTAGDAEFSRNPSAQS